MSEIKEFYTLAEACALLKVNPQTLAARFRKGEIKAKKKLGRWYVLHEDILAFMKS